MKLHGVLTKITLKNAANKDGVAYSMPVFEVADTLPPEFTERVRQYAGAFVAAINGEAIREPAATDHDVDEEPLPFD